MKKKTKIIIGILIAAVIAAAGITWYVMNQKNQKTGNSSAEVVAWDVDIEEEEPSEEKGILIPGYTSMVMKANTKEQTVSLAIAYTYNWTEEQCAFLNVSRNIVRIHCGLEGTENLIADLQQALDKIS